MTHHIRQDNMFLILWFHPTHQLLIPLTKNPRPSPLPNLAAFFLSANQTLQGLYQYLQLERTQTHNIKALTSGSGIDVLLLEDAEATTDKVKTEMKAHNWVHFACHGIQDVGDPLKSGVHLHDGHLELLEIMWQLVFESPVFCLFW